MCWNFVILKAVLSFEFDVPYSSSKTRGGTYGSGGNSVLVSSIRKYVGVTIFRLNMKTCEQEGRSDFDFVSVHNSM